MKPSSLKPAPKLTIEQINAQIAKKNEKKALIENVLALIDKISGDIESPLWGHIKGKLTEMMSGVDQLKDRIGEYNPQAHPIQDRVFWNAIGIEQACKKILVIEQMVENRKGYEDSLIETSKEIKDLVLQRQRIANPQ